MDETIAWLGSPDGQGLITQLAGHDALSARRAFPGISVDRLTQALQQSALRQRGATTALATETGLQQATPTAIATARARRLADQGVTRIIDAGCGIGSDSRAFAQAGLSVMAYELDPATADIARVNTEGLDVTVTTADVTKADLPQGWALFVDPARRAAHHTVDGRPVRVGDAQQWRPPWDWVLARAGAHPTVARIGPTLRHLPPGELHCTSLDGAVVDITVWMGDLARVDRRATVRRGDRELELDSRDRPGAGPGPVGPFLLDPDPAIVRAGLVAEAAQDTGGWLIDDHLAFITAEQDGEPLLGRWYTVLEHLPARAAPIRTACAAHGISTLGVISRGVADTGRLIRQVGLPDGSDGTLVVARIGHPRRETVTFLCRRQ